MLQDEILKLGEYFQSIEYFGKALIVKVKFPPKWSVFPSDDNEIKPANGDVEGLYFYYGNSENGVKLEDIFELINKTIAMNKSVVMKVELLKSKIAELKELFADSSLEELQNLKFVFEKPKKKRTYKRKNKEEKIEEAKNDE